MADAEDPRDQLKEAGRGWGERIFPEILLQLTVLGITPSVNRQGKEPEEPTAAYTTEELSWGVEIPGERTDKMDERLLQKLFIEEAGI